MNYFFQLLFWVPLVLTAIILLWLFYLELKSRATAKTARRAFWVVIIINFLTIVAKLVYVYLTLKKDEFGQFLLPGKSDYFYRVSWLMSSSFVYSLLIGLVLVLVLLIFRRIIKAKVVDWSDLYILLICVIAVGAQSVVVLLLGSFFLMIFFMIGYSLRKKKVANQSRLVLSPFLLITAFIILIISNLPTDRPGFDFYFRFLDLLHLT